MRRRRFNDTTISAVAFIIVVVWLVFSSFSDRFDLFEDSLVDRVYESDKKTLRLVKKLKINGQSEKFYEKVLINPNRAAYNLTIVAQYFYLIKSKHSDTKYRMWMRNFLQAVSKTPIVIYTDVKSSENVLELIKRTPNPKTVLIFDDIWRLVDLFELESDRTIRLRDIYEREQRSIDPEHQLHSSELYAVWNLKSYMVYRSAQENEYKSSYFVYNDIGSFRHASIKDSWPNEQFTVRTLAKLNDRILFSQIAQKPPQNPYSSLGDYIQGGFFAGSARAIQFMYEHFYAIHDQLASHGRFVGKDQKIMNIISHRLADRVCQLSMFSLGECLVDPNVWFVYKNYFSSCFAVSAYSQLFDSESECYLEANKLIRLNASSIRCDSDREHVGLSNWLLCNKN